MERIEGFFRPSYISNTLKRAVDAGVVAIVLSILFVVGGCKQAEQVAAPPVPVVEVVTVFQKDVPIYSEWVGSLDGSINAVIRPQVTGYLVRQNYREGELVHKGQVLFEIDPRTFQADVKQAKPPLKRPRAIWPPRRPLRRPPKPISPGSSPWPQRTRYPKKISISP